MMINVNFKCKQSILWHWFYNFVFTLEYVMHNVFIFINLTKHQAIDLTIWCTYFNEVLKEYGLQLRFFLIINNYDFCTFYIN
jgi:hypothetical protein